MTIINLLRHPNSNYRQMTVDQTRTMDPTLPLYQQMAEQLRRDIETGVYPVGSSLPTEAQLCESYAVSRHTARDALRLLEQAGYVSRRRGAGTYVESARPRSRYSQSLESLDDLFRYAHETRFVIEQIKRLKPGVELAAFLDTKAGTPLLRLSGLRYPILSDMPFSLTEIYINRKFESALPTIETHRGAICALIEDLFPVRIKRIGQDIQALTLSPEEAARLQVKAGTAALKVVRRYFDEDGDLIEVSSNLYPGARFTYSSWIDRDDTV